MQFFLIKRILVNWGNFGDLDKLILILVLIVISEFNKKYKLKFTKPGTIIYF